MAVSSGTTGKATIWPRTQGDEMRTAFAFEQIFSESFGVEGRRTLALVCFPLGIWIGGMYTASAVRMLARKGRSVTVLTPGINLAEIRRCLHEVAPIFDQTVMCGYPPTIRDFLDELAPSEIDPAVIRIKLLLAGEAVSESWRDDMSAKLAMDPGECGIVSMFGTADAGLVGFETARTIEARRILERSPAMRESAFGNPGLPSLFQYQPFGIQVAEAEDKVLLTMPGLHPHFRYSIGDAGTGLPFAELRSRVPGLTLRDSHELPAIALFGRTDHTVSFFGGNVYPEHVAAIMDRSDFRAHITGRFTMLVQHSAEANAPLTVVVELKAASEPPDGFTNLLAEALEAHLVATNSEYANYVPPRYRRPLVELRTYRDDEFFSRGKKQVYVLAR